jgi:hypothetical protein
MVLGLPSPTTHDFTLEKYRKLCKVLLKRGYSPLTVRNYLGDGSGKGEKTVIFRHDVDRKTLNALRMAKLEYEMGICSTYYFRYPYTFIPETIKLIHNMGHEVGYHYETLSKAKGDLGQGIDLFKKELAAFREIPGCEIKTICMHGSPLSPYDNRDLWEKYDFRDYDIEGEAYLSMTGKDFVYLTDTGRTWAAKYSVRDAMPGAGGIPAVETTDHLIEWIRSVKNHVLYLTVHPERWAVSGTDWAISYIKDVVMNTGKAGILAVTGGLK